MLHLTLILASALSAPGPAGTAHLPGTSHAPGTSHYTSPVPCVCEFEITITYQNKTIISAATITTLDQLLEAQFNQIGVAGGFETAVYGLSAPVPPATTHGMGMGPAPLSTFQLIFFVDVFEPNCSQPNTAYFNIYNGYNLTLAAAQLGVTAVSSIHFDAEGPKCEACPQLSTFKNQCFDRLTGVNLAEACQEVNSAILCAVGGNFDPFVTRSILEKLAADSEMDKPVAPHGPPPPPACSVDLSTLSGLVTFATTACQEVVVLTPPSPSTTPSSSVSPSETPSVSPSETPSVSPSETPSVSPSLTPSVTPSDTPSVSPSPSHS